MGEAVAADRHARAEHDAALGAVREPVEVALELARAREHVFGPGVDGVARLGEVEMPALAVEERGAESLLERADVPGDDRLRDEQVIRGAPDTAELDDQREHLELVQRDAEVQRHAVGNAYCLGGTHTELMRPTIHLAHGAAMPRLGLGTWPLVGDEARAAVCTR